MVKEENFVKEIEDFYINAKKENIALKREYVDMALQLVPEMSKYLDAMPSLSVSSLENYETLALKLHGSHERMQFKFSGNVITVIRLGSEPLNFGETINPTQLNILLKKQDI